MGNGFAHSKSRNDRVWRYGCPAQFECSISIGSPSLFCSASLRSLQGPKVCFDSSKDSPEDEGVRWEDGKLIVEADRILCGDYQLWILTPERDRVHGSGMTSALASGAAAPGGEEDTAGPAGAMSARAGHRRERRYAARFVFHTSLLEEGINSYGSEEVDIFRTGIDKRSFTLTLVMAEVPTETLLDLNLDKAMKRSFLNLKGSAAIVKGAEEFSAHHYTFPDAKLLKTLVSSHGAAFELACVDPPRTESTFGSNVALVATSHRALVGNDLPTC